MDLFVPAMVSRGVGETLAGLLGSLGGEAESAAGAGGARRVPASGALGADGLREAIQHLAGRRGLVFVVSDFHWPLAALGATLDTLVHSFVVPVVIWDPAELEPPSRNGLLQLRDTESGAQRALWMRPRLRARWRESVQERRHELQQIFGMHAIRPFHITGHFDAEALSQYFFEVAAQ
jgi:hypothetical protein